MRIYIIEWLDSKFFPGGWQCREHLENKLGYCVTIGLLLEENKSTITVVPNVSGGFYAQGMVIPKCSIKRRRRLKIK